MIDADKYHKLYDAYTKGDESGEYEDVLKELSGGGEDTTSKVLFKDDARRKQLHEKIIETELDGKSSQNNPKLRFIVGHIGAGKTSLKDRLKDEYGQDMKNYVSINFDAIKRYLPEYDVLKRINYKKASAFIQSEVATQIAPKLFKKALQQHKHIIFEKNITPKKDNSPHQITQDISQAIKREYKDVFIHVIFLDSVETALFRVSKRLEEGTKQGTKGKIYGRYVPKEDVRRSFEKLFANLSLALKEIMDKIEIQKYMLLNIEFIYNGYDKPKKLLHVAYWKFLQDIMKQKHIKLTSNSSQKEINHAVWKLAEEAVSEFVTRLIKNKKLSPKQRSLVFFLRSISWLVYKWNRKKIIAKLYSLYFAPEKLIVLKQKHALGLFVSEKL